MKNFRKEKGITLVALIITIVILLILAAVAIAAIQNENILSHANNAAIKYNSSVDREQGILGGYLDVLDKYTGNEWITIYEGSATTEDGMAVLGEIDLFTYGQLGVPYKITVSSTEFSGSVETVPIFAGTEEGMNTYALFATANGQAVGFTSLGDAQNKISNLGENVTMVAGVSGAGMCGIMLDGATCEYTITKVERKENGNKIFEGEIALTTNEGGATIPELQGILKYTRDYAFEVEINGATQILEVRTFWLLGTICLLYRNDDGDAVGVKIDENLIGCSIEDCILKNIYDIGPSASYFEENGFAAIDLGVFDGYEDECYLIQTPNTSFIVPETIAGKEITTFYIDSIGGEPTFTKEVKLRAGDYGEKNVKIISNNLDFWFDQLGWVINLGNLNVDLTECGDEIVFPQDYLDSGTTTYVTSAVKANYPDNDNIIAK